MDKPAFPGGDDGNYGLTKRELFAAMAMVGLLVNYEQGEHAQVALWAVKHADALLYELNRERRLGMSDDGSLNPQVGGTKAPT